jgi:hypothetical protein
MDPDLIICTELKYELPKTLHVSGKTVHVQDVYMPELHNIPRFEAVISADGAQYDIQVPSVHCKNVEQLSRHFRSHLGHFAKFSVSKNKLSIEPLDDANIQFGHKMARILNTSDISKKTTCEPDLLRHVQRIYLCSPIVESSIVGKSFVYLLFHGCPGKKVPVLKRKLRVALIDGFDLQIFDADLDPLDVDPSTFSITLRFEDAGG